VNPIDKAGHIFIKQASKGTIALACYYDYHLVLGYFLALYIDNIDIDIYCDQSCVALISSDLLISI